MKRSIPLVIVAVVSLVLSGCITDTADPPGTDGSPTPTQTTSPTPTPTNGTDEFPDDPPGANITATNVSGEAPLAVTFRLSSEERDARFLDWTFDADGDGAADETGYGLPADVEFTYEEPGNYTANLTVTDPSGKRGSTTLEVTVVAAAPVEELKTLWFNGTITGISDQDGGYLMGGDVNHTFNLTKEVANISLTFTVGDTAFDLDFTLVRPDGEEAANTARPNDPTGTVFGKADPPILEEDPEDLAVLGTWTIIVHPYLAYEGDYSIEVRFG